MIILVLSLSYKVSLYFFTLLRKSTIEVGNKKWHIKNGFTFGQHPCVISTGLTSDSCPRPGKTLTAVTTLGHKDTPHVQSHQRQAEGWCRLMITPTPTSNWNMLTYK